MLLVPPHSGPADKRVVLPGSRRADRHQRIFKKVEDCELTVLRGELRCSSRNTGSDSKSDVLPFWLTRGPSLETFNDWFVRDAEDGAERLIFDSAILNFVTRQERSKSEGGSR